MVTDMTRPGRCPNCGGPLLNTPGGSCCARALGCSRIQRRLSRGLDLVNRLEANGTVIPLATHVGNAAFCRGELHTRRIYRMEGSEQLYRRVRRSRSLAELELRGNWWALWGDKLIELVKYAPCETDRMFAPNPNGATQ